MYCTLEYEKCSEGEVIPAHGIQRGNVIGCKRFRYGAGTNAPFITQVRGIFRHSLQQYSHTYGRVKALTSYKQEWNRGIIQFSQV